MDCRWTLTPVALRVCGGTVFVVRHRVAFGYESVLLFRSRRTRGGHAWLLQADIAAIAADGASRQPATTGGRVLRFHAHSYELAATSDALPHCHHQDNEI